MNNGTVKIRIFDWNDVKSLEKVGFVRLTKWLDGLNEEMTYLRDEYVRISSDPLRSCAIVTLNGKYALYVNDITYGAFDQVYDNDDESDS